MSQATWPIKRVSGTLPDRNVPLDVAEDALTWSAEEDLEITAAVYSPYFVKAEQGATIMPRPFWFVEPQGATGNGWRNVRTPPQQSVSAKAPWTGLAFEGRIEDAYLFVTFLDLFPFLIGPTKLVALPVKLSSTGQKMELLSIDDVAARGTPHLYDWMRNVENVWQERKKKSRAQNTTSARYLNNHSNLTRQNLSRSRLIYSGKGSNLRAAVLDPADLVSGAPVPVNGFVLDQNFYEISCSEAEAHYLAAILNTDQANNAIKSTQTQGAFGARDIHRRPFEVLPIPSYDADDQRHRQLVELSQLAHQTLAGSTGHTSRVRALASVAADVAKAGQLVDDMLGIGV